MQNTMYLVFFTALALIISSSFAVPTHKSHRAHGHRHGKGYGVVGYGGYGGGYGFGYGNGGYGNGFGNGFGYGSGYGSGYGAGYGSGGYGIRAPIGSGFGAGASAAAGSGFFIRKRDIPSLPVDLTVTSKKQEVKSDKIKAKSEKTSDV
ncbi:hypothetical protein PPACK8108_LOCUS24003 [Phakopsora pachyrhizi]|uniref:Uncharacterized protein n=1 Tax=Phakopsora pachyrhizi TaxID=170000 RepID=A0AAV0BNV4_PHAPC|nr:hypothetical protein PPACK8108_LOCUS24003 [Phakopsora pachyrhizi]